MGPWLDSVTGWLTANPQWLGLAVFIVACVECLAIAGIIVAAHIRGADANNAGLWLELDAILAVVIGGGSLMGGRFNLLLSVVGALIIQGMNTGILLSGFQPELNQVVKAVVVMCVLIVQSPRFIQILKRIRGHDKT